MHIFKIQYFTIKKPKWAAELLPVVYAFSRFASSISHTLSFQRIWLSFFCFINVIYMYWHFVRYYLQDSYSLSKNHFGQSENHNGHSKNHFGRSVVIKNLFGWRNSHFLIKKPFWVCVRSLYRHHFSVKKPFWASATTLIWKSLYSILATTLAISIFLIAEQSCDTSVKCIIPLY